jgi:predicted unusual protein kinase regulating ubiquinone biosynthesis (AarF/ABC1/UbiB family)
MRFMKQDRQTSRGLRVPSSRLSRLARFGGMAGGVASGMALDAARQVAAGRRPSVADLLMTPANVSRVTRELAHLRGAAMKMGQLLSMDSGDMLPPELAQILARLRADAEHMPPRQLRAALDRQWGRGWLDRFEHFDVRPIAAASIGQVHRARTRDGRDLAIKIQYPGIRRSIDSDVDNVGALMRLSGALPPQIDLAPMLAEAKRQLHEEADYEREGRCLQRFAALLADDPIFRVPRLHADLTTPDVLAMDYMPGAPIEALTDAPQGERDRAATALLDLCLRELFAFRLMQTDPNFANYRYDRATGRMILLDFGATREIPAELSDGYRRLMREALSGDRPAIRASMTGLGFFDEAAFGKHEAAIMAMVDKGLAPLLAGGPFDFGDRTLARELRDEGVALAGDRDFWRIPPMDSLFIQRKGLGMYLLAARLGARVDIRRLLEAWG